MGSHHHAPASLINKTDLDSEDDSTTALGFLMKYKSFTIFLIGITLIFYSHNIINTYLINIFENVGGSEENVGIALAIAAALELPVMAGFILLLKKFKCSSKIEFSAVFYFVKSFIPLLASSVSALYLAQTLQVLGFALYTPVSVLTSMTGGVIQDTLGVTAMLVIATISFNWLQYGFLLFYNLIKIYM